MKRASVFFLFACVLSACAPQTQTARGWELAKRERVTIKDLRPAGIAAFRGPELPGVDPTLRRYNVRAELMIFPRQAPMVGVLTDALLPARVDASVKSRWRDNGLHIGLLETRRVDLFKSNLMSSLDGELRPLAYSLLNAVRYTPLELTRPQRGARRVRTAEADGRWLEREFTGGQFRFLIKLEEPATAGGPVRVDLMPQHHRRLHRVQPLPVEQRVLDGTAFESLRLLEPLDTQHAWVIWADLPKLDAADRAPAFINARPVTLAEAMLGGYRRDRPAQALLIIRLEKTDQK